jgi:predicted dehydrogenase
LVNTFFDRRKTATHPAGFVLDACIHFVAIIRFLLAANGQTVKMTSAHTKLIDPALPPVDSVFALLQTDRGVSGTFSFSVGISSLDGIEYDIVTDKGNICVRGPTVVTTAITDQASKAIENKFEDPMTFGVPDEFAAFGEALAGSTLDSRISIEEALADLQLLEAMLKSGEQNGQPVTIG